MAAVLLDTVQAKVELIVVFIVLISPTYGI